MLINRKKSDGSSELVGPVVEGVGEVQSGGTQPQLGGVQSVEDAEIQQELVQTVSAQPKADAKSASEVLAEIMLKREARLARKEEEEEARIAAKNKQRDFNAQHASDSTIEIQATCKHLKGGRSGPRSQVRDFAICIHTFINAEQVIWCHICNARWKMNDTKEFLYRFGKKVPNHTKIGWAEACEMLTQTTNKPSTSEIPMTARPTALPSDIGVS